MSRNKRFIAATVVVGIVGICIGTFAMPRIERDAADSASASHGPSPEGTGGQHGGVVVKDGKLAVEIVMTEKPGDARLIVYPFVDGKPADASLSLSGEIRRYDGTRHPIRFERAETKFVSTESIAKPHVFDATLEVKWRGAMASIPFSRTDGAIELTDEQLKSAGIVLATAGPAQIAAPFQLPGEIKFNEDRTAHVVPRVAGIVERVPVSLGQRVKKGQVLAIIASADLADRRSELLTAQRRLTAARATYAREKTLWQERISAEQDYQAAQAQLREAQIAEDNARQKLAALNAPPDAKSLNRYELLAPFDATVVEKHATAGEAIAADASLFVVSDLTSVWAEMAVPAQRLNDVRVGREAIVSAAAFESKSSGPIAYVGALLGEQTRTAPARVVLPNPDGVWRPGMFVNVSLDAGKQLAALTVSTEALQEIDGAPSVFVRSPKGFVAQAVQIGRRDEQATEVVKGLRAGQHYAASNSFVLKAELGKDGVEHD